MYEGINPPYVCDGTIYTRSGSSKVPIKSDRSSIDELLNKRTKFNNMLKEFCVNQFVSERDKFPYCTIYLYNPYKKLDYSCFDEKVEKIKQEFREDGTGGRILDSIDSVIKMGSDVISANSYTSIEEYFVDDNIKIYMPLFMLKNTGNISSWIDTVAVYNSNVDMKDMIIVDGMITYFSLFKMLEAAFEYIKKVGNNICDYRIVFEYKNVKNVVFYHRHNFEKQENRDRFVKDIQEGKFFVCHLSDIVTEPLFFRTEGTVEEANQYAGELLEMRYLRLFGLNREAFSEVLDKSEGKYNDKVFSSHT